MATCIRELVAHDRRVQNEHKYQLARMGRFVNSNYDEEMSNVLRFTTHHVAQQVESQYSIGISKSSIYSYNVDEFQAGLVQVRGRHNAAHLSTEEWSCDCTFAKSMQLPCRHVIAYRKLTNASGPVIPWCRIDERYIFTFYFIYLLRILNTFQTLGGQITRSLCKVLVGSNTRRLSEMRRN